MPDTENAFGKRITEMAKKLKETSPEEIKLFEGQRSEFIVTPAEKIRFEANSEFSKIIYDVFSKAIDTKTTRQELESELDELETQLSPAQQEVITGIRNSLKEGLGYQFSRLSSAQTLDEFRRNVDGVHSLFYNGVKHLGITSRQISCQDILQIFVLSYHSLLHFLLQ